VLAELAAANPGDAELNTALKNISARKTMQKGGYDALADGKGSYRDILRNKEEAVSLEQEKRQVKTEDVTERLIGEYEARLPQEPTNLKLLKDLAELYTSKKQFDRALSYYERIKATTEGAADPALDKGIADTMLRKFDQQIAGLDPTAPEYAQQVAKLQSEKQGYQLAEVQKRAERFPTDLNIRYELGQLYFQTGKIMEAVSEFQKAQQNPHRRVKAMSYLGQCYARRNMNDLAVRTFEAALKEKLVWDDEKKEIAYSLGAVLEKIGKRDDAKKQFEDIFAIDSGYKDVAKKMDEYYGGDGAGAAA
jgi:tetratricopeptide (TPR) repeat protein